MSLSLKRSHVGRVRRSAQYSRRAIWAAIEPLEPRQLLSATIEQAVNFPIPNVNDGSNRPVATAHDEGYLVDLNSTYTANGTPIYDIVFLGEQGLTVMFGNGDGTFRAPTVYPVPAPTGGFGDRYADMVLADVNGDGLLDAVVVESYGTALHKGPPTGQAGVVGVFLANSNGTFKQGAFYMAGNTPDAVAVGELGDGEMDIAIANRKTRSVTILEGNGSGKFTVLKNNISGVPPYPNSIEIGDVNGDGIGDIVVAGYNPNNTATNGSVAVLLGSGGLNFNPLSQYLAANRATLVGIETYKGQPEIIAAGTTFTNTKPAGTLPVFSTSINDDVGTLEDVNGDGILDSISATYRYSTVTVSLTSVTGPTPYSNRRAYSTVAPYYSASQRGPIEIGYGTEAIAVPIAEPGQTATIDGDLNGAKTAQGTDIIDLVTLDHGGFGVSSGPAVSVIFGFGNGNFEAQKFNLDQNADGVGNLTRKPPVPIPGTEGTITYPAVKTSKQLFQYTSSYPNDLVTADIGGDGLQAIIAATYGVGPTIGAPGSGTFGSNGSSALNITQPVSPIASNYPGQITIFANDGDGSFSILQTITDPYGPVAVAVGDVTGDGIPDLIVVNKYANFYGNSQETGNLWIFKGSANGKFDATPGQFAHFYAGLNPKSVALANLNGDGYSILVADNGRYYNQLPTTKSIFGEYQFSFTSGVKSAKTAVYNVVSPYLPLDITHAPQNGNGPENKDFPKHYVPGGIRALINEGGDSFNDVNTKLPYTPGGVPVYAAPPLVIKPGGDALYSNAPEIVGNRAFSVPYGATDLLVGNFINGDGVPDSTIAVAYEKFHYYAYTKTLDRYYQGKVVMLEGDGDGTATAVSSTYLGSPEPIQLVAGHFNGPKSPLDIAALSQTYEAISILSGNGDGTFALSQQLQLDNQNFLADNPNENEYVPIAIASGNINGDGYDDLAVAYAGTDTKQGYKIGLFRNQYDVSDGASTGFSNNPTDTIHDTRQTEFIEKFHPNGSNALKDISPTPFGILMVPISGDGLGSNRSQIITANNDLNYYADVTTFLFAQPPQITSAANFTMTVGSQGSDTLTAMGDPPPFFTEIGLLPAGVTFIGDSNGTAAITGTPEAGTQGQYVLTILADNGVQDTLSGAGVDTEALQTFTLDVDQAPVFTGTNGFSLAEGYPVGVKIPTIAFPLPVLTESPNLALGNTNPNNGLPAGLTFVDSGSGTGEIVGTATDTGTFNVIITATNSLAPGGVDLPITLYVSAPQTAAFTSTPSSATFTTGVTGTVTLTASGLPIPILALAEGHFPAGVSIISNTDGTLIFSGTPTYGDGGVYQLLFTAANGVPNNGTSASNFYTLTVDQPAGLSANSVGTFKLDTSGSFPVTTTGFPAPTVIITSGNLPPGLSLVSNLNGTATILGTPTAAGAYTITLGDTNTVYLNGTNTTTTRTETVTLNVDQAPTFAIGTANTNIGGTIQFIAGTIPVPTQYYNIVAYGFPAPTISELGFLPAGVSFTTVSSSTATTASFSNTPLAGSGGNYNLLISATNSLGTATIPVPPNNTSTSFDFVLTIAQPPSIISAGSATFTVGSQSSYPIDAIGFPGPTISETGSLPPGITFTGNALTGTPTVGGVFDITLTASNGFSPSATQAFILTVDGSPSFSATNVTTTFGIGISNSYTVTVSGYPEPSFVVPQPLPTGFDGLTFIDNGNGTGTLEGTPTDAVGTYQLVITATSALGSAPTPETLTLDLVNPGTAVFVGSASDSVPVLANDTVVIQTTGLPTASLSVLPISLPTWASFTDEGNGTGEITGTPPLSAGNTVNDISIFASNSFGVTTEVFVLTVTAQAPAFTGATAATVTVGTSAAFTATATGFPTPALSVIGTLPTGLSFADNGNGTGAFMGTPSGSGGVYDVTLQASNGIGQPITEIFVIDVDQAPTITSAGSTTFVVGTGGTFTFVSSGFPTASLQVVNGSGSLPSGITFADDGNGDATLEGTPTTGEGGTYTFSVSATNGVGSGSTQQFTLTIDQLPTFTSVNTSAVSTGTPENFTVSVNAFPIAAISETGLPAGLHLSLVDNGNDTATLSGTPPAGTEGSYTFTISAGNSQGTMTQSFTLDVTQTPGISSGNLGSGTAGAVFTVGTTQTAIINTTGFPTPTLSFTGTLPNGLTFESLGTGSAEITGTPTGPGGPDTLTLIATSGGTHTSEPYVIIVDEAPVFTSANSTSNFAVDLPGVTYNVTTTSFPGDSFNSPVGLPAGLSLVDNANGTATLEGTPTGPAGTYHVAIVATNTVGATTQGFTVVVGNAPIVTLVSGVLTVTGTPGADSASVMVSGSNVIVDIDQLQNVNFPLSSVTSVVVNDEGGADSLTIGANVPPTSVMGGTGADTIIATNSAPDTIIGGAGSSSISATGAGDNLLISADAVSTGTTILAGSGNSTLFSGSGSDSLVGGSGNDFLRATGPGSSTLMGGSGDSTLKALSGNDSLVGGSGAMVKIKGGSGTDTLIAGSGSTTVRSVSGHDSIVANSGGAALIKAANHQDTIVGAIGSSGMDTIFYDSGDSVGAATLDSPLDTMILVND